MEKRDWRYYNIRTQNNRRTNSIYDYRYLLDMEEIKYDCVYKNYGHISTSSIR